MDQLLNDFLNSVFPGVKPIWLILLAGFIAFALVLQSITFTWDFVNSTRKRIRKWILSLDEDNAAKINERKNFSKRIALELSILNSQETWQEERYTELEAEVEAEDSWYRKSSWLPIGYTQKGIHREKSIYVALEKTLEPLILLEGEPGSGKSVILRHLALTLALKAGESNDLNSIIPLYINMKDLKVNSLEEVTPNMVREFVFRSINKQNDRNMAIFLEREFDLGIKDGTWLFLFDSFDEIPDILSSTQVDNTVQKYTLALSRFLYDLGKCRGIIASRYFRGPELINWPRFRIQPLNEKRRIELIKKYGLGKKSWVRLINDLESAPDQIRDMAKNPMFLSLLCENIKDGKQFPDHIHNVYVDFIDERLKRDEARIQKRFGVSKETIRSNCGNIAFCMTADPGLGLSPDRSALKNSLSLHHFPISENIDTIFDAIEFTRLGKSVYLPAENIKQFTFAHRRLQEYFATHKVILEEAQVSPYQLITNGRWRETAVTLLQIQPENNLTTVFVEAEKIIDHYLKNLSRVESEYVYSCRSRYYFEWPPKAMPRNNSEQLPVPFNWPSELIHILSILKDGLSSRSNILPKSIRNKLAVILNWAFETGLILDKKWALEFVSLVPKGLMEKMLLDGISLEDKWLDDVIYRQVTKLSHHPEKIRKGILKSIISLVFSGRYWEEKYATQAYIQRLSGSSTYETILHLFVRLPVIDLAFNLIIVSFLASLIFYYSSQDNTSAVMWIIIVGFYLFILALPAFLLASRLFRFVRNFMKDSGVSINEFISGFRLLIFILLFLALISVLIRMIHDGMNINILNVSLTFVILFMANAWPATYFTFARKGIALHPFFWIFSPIAWIFHVILGWIKDIVKLPQRLIKGWMNFQFRWGKNELLVVGLSFVLTIISSLIVWGFLITNSGQIKTGDQIAINAAILAIFIIPSVVLYFVFRNIKSKLFSRIRNVNAIDINDALPLLEEAYGKGFGDVIVKYIREKQLLRITPETEYGIQKLTSFAQFSRKMYFKGYYVNYYPSQGRSMNNFDSWLVDLQNRRKDVFQTIPWSAMIELNRILEQHKKMS